MQLLAIVPDETFLKEDLDPVLDHGEGSLPLHVRRARQIRPLSQERAEWFARRPGNAAAVLKLQLDQPWEIKACFLGREEEEIVVDCRNLEPPAVSWI